MSAEIMEFEAAQKRFERAFAAYELATDCMCAANNITSDIGGVEVQSRYRRIVSEEFPGQFQQRYDKELTVNDREACRRRLVELEDELALLLTDFVERKITEMHAGAA